MTDAVTLPEHDTGWLAAAIVVGSHMLEHVNTGLEFILLAVAVFKVARSWWTHPHRGRGFALTVVHFARAVARAQQRLREPAP